MKLNTKLLTISALFIAALMLLSPISQTNTSGGGGIGNSDLDFLNSLDINNNNFVLSADQNSYSDTVSISEITSSSEGKLFIKNDEIAYTIAITVSNTDELDILSGIVNSTYQPNQSQQPIKSDFSGYTVILTGSLIFDDSIQAGESNFTPIGKDEQHAFNGTFDGQGHTISNLSVNINSKSGNVYSGLFGYLGSDATVKNLGMINSLIFADSTDSSAYSGGIAGYNQGTITNCYNTGEVTGSDSGGIAGYNNQGKIEKCYNIGFVTADSADKQAFSGGIAGLNSGIIINCYNTGVVIADSTNGNAYSGGIAGTNEGTITNCYNTGTVTASSNSGGIAGTNGGTITNCYNTGDVTGSGISGGIAGTTYEMITNCYNTGDVTGIENSGGITGYNQGTITNCYSKSNGNQSLIGNGDTPNTCKTFDENGEFSDGSGSLLDALNEWVENANVGKSEKYRYWMNPFIQNEKYPVFTDWYGEAKRLNISFPDPNSNGVYEITNGYQLALIADMPNGKYIQSDNIDLSGYEWRPIGNDSEQFTGTLDGQEYMISNLSVNINSKSGNVYSGLFGYLGSDATVKNLKIINSEISAYSAGGDAYSGGIAGYNKGTITNCYNIGNVKATSTADNKWVYSGGIAGKSSGTITNCYNLGDVKSTASIRVNSGGITGYDEGTITNCYNLGDVTAYSTDHEALSGGITGKSTLYGGTITNCYNTGSVKATSTNNYACSGGIAGDNSGTITNCYNTGSVKATSTNDIAYSGGIAGDNSGTITNCYNTGIVTATANNNTYSGGIAGRNYRGTITNCYNAGDVTAISTNETAYSGGIAGRNQDAIENCYNTGGVTATSANKNARSGGIAGYNDKGTITNCYNLGDVTANSANGDANSGGIAGRNWGAIENCYNLGAVTGTTYSGGIAGYNSEGTIENTFYLESADDKLPGIGNTQEDNESNTKKLTSDDMKGLKLLGGDGSKYDLNKEQDPKPWSPDIFNVNDGYPILADVPTQIDPSKSANTPPQSAVYVTLDNESAQAENYLTPFTLTNGNEVAATVNYLINPGKDITSHQWYTMNDKGVFIEVDTSSTETIQETYYVKVTIDGYSYTSLTRTVSDTFIVMFDNNGGSGVGSIMVSKNEAITEPKDPTKTGYTFEGWYTDTEFNVEYNFGTSVSENMTLYAKWKEIEYSVKYNGNNNTSGTVPTDNEKYKIGREIELASNDGNLAKSGYIFRGWNYTPNASSALPLKITLSESVIENYINTVPNNTTLTLYAVWTPIPEPIYTLCLNSNDSTLQTKRYSGTYGTEVTLKSASDFGWNESCKFIEWNSKSDGSGVSYKEGNKFSLGSDVWNLYAIWSDSSYHTVSFDSNGGNSIPSQNIQDGYRASVPDAPTKQGHSFKHWSLNGVKYDFNQSVKEDITLKAEYEIISYKVTFYYNGEVYYSTQADYNTSLGDRMPSLPSDKDKWNTNEDGKGNNFTADSLITSDTSVYAVSENSISSILIIGGSAAAILAAIAAWMFMRSRYN